MSRLLAAGLMVLSGVSWASADVQPAQAEKAKLPPLKQAVVDNPDNPAALGTYLSAEFRKLIPLATSDPDAAEKGLGELEGFVKSLRPKTGLPSCW